jgi:hypothetical protein
MAAPESKQTSLQEELMNAESKSKSSSTDHNWPQPILASIEAVKSVISTSNSKPATKRPRLRKHPRQAHGSGTCKNVRMINSYNSIYNQK